MRKRALITLVIALLVPGSTFAADLAAVLKGRGNVFWKVITDGLNDGAKSAGVPISIFNTDNDQDPEAQLNLCLTALQRKPSFLILGAATKSVGIECFKRAAAAGIPFGDIDGNVTVEDGKAAGLNLAFSVGSDNLKIGEAAAEFMVTKLKGERPKLLVLKGLPGSIVSENRANGFLAKLRLLRNDAEIVATPTTDWDRMKAMNISLDSLQRDNTLQAIFSVSDVMSMGVVEAIRVAKRDITLVSVDGIADARTAIKSGRISGCVAQLPFLMGRRAAELAVEGKSQGLTEFIPTPTLTKDILEKNTDPLLQYMR